MYHRIYSFLYKYKLINTNQFGFHSNHSIEHALISLIETIKKSLDNDEIVCGVFIDLPYFSYFTDTSRDKKM